jgi:superfamily I DNA/RNA helicase
MAYNGGATKDPPDERRLAYVALSRAAERLILTAPQHVEVSGHLIAVSVSRYLGEALEPETRRQGPPPGTDRLNGV